MYWNIKILLTYKLYCFREKLRQVLTPMVDDGNLLVAVAGVGLENVGQIGSDVEYVSDAILGQHLLAGGVFGAAQVQARQYFGGRRQGVVARLWSLKSRFAVITIDPESAGQNVRVWLEHVVLFFRSQRSNLQGAESKDRSGASKWRQRRTSARSRVVAVKLFLACSLASAVVASVRVQWNAAFRKLSFEAVVATCRLQTNFKSGNLK